METKTVTVPNIGCAGCVSTVKSAVNSVAGVVSVEGDPTTKAVTIQWDNPADWSTIRDTMAGIDYAPAEA